MRAADNPNPAWPAVAKLFHRRDPRFAGLAWAIHEKIRGMRRHHPERVKQAGIIRHYRSGGGQ